jgi:hypothetical protein
MPPSAARSPARPVRLQYRDADRVENELGCLRNGLRVAAQRTIMKLRLVDNDGEGAAVDLTQRGPDESVERCARRVIGRLQQPLGEELKPHAGELEPGVEQGALDDHCRARLEIGHRFCSRSGAPVSH